MFRLVALLLCASASEAKIFSRCELANALKNAGITEDNVYKWVCIGQHNGLDTSRNQQSPDGSIRSYGLFKISDEYWCDRTDYGTGKMCRMACKQLMDDDIRDDIRCAMNIYNQHGGFNAWIPWMPECKDVNKNYLRECNLGSSAVMDTIQLQIGDDGEQSTYSSSKNTDDDLDFWNNSGFLERFE